MNMKIGITPLTPKSPSRLHAERDEGDQKNDTERPSKEPGGNRIGSVVSPSSHRNRAYHSGVPSVSVNCTTGKRPGTGVLGHGDPLAPHTSSRHTARLAPRSLCCPYRAVFLRKTLAYGDVILFRARSRP